MVKEKYRLKSMNRIIKKYILFVIFIVIAASAWITYMNVVHFPDVLPIGRIIGLLIFILAGAIFIRQRGIDISEINRQSILNSIFKYALVGAFLSIGYILGAVLETLLLSAFSSNKFSKIIKIANTLPSVSEVYTIFVYSIVLVALYYFITNIAEKTGPYISILFFLLIIDYLNGFRIISFLLNYLTCMNNDFSSYIYWTLRMLLLALIFITINQLLTVNHRYSKKTKYD